MTERLVNVFYWIANSVALLFLFASATIGWAEYLWQLAGGYTLTIVFAATAFAAWVAGRIFLFLSTGR